MSATWLVWQLLQGRSEAAYQTVPHSVLFSTQTVKMKLVQQTLHLPSPAGVAALPLVTGVTLSFRAFSPSSDDSLLLSLELSSSASCEGFTLSFTFSAADPPFPLAPVVCGASSSELEESELELELLSA